jgi:hypothetical protein
MTFSPMAPCTAPLRFARSFAVRFVVTLTVAFALAAVPGGCAAGDKSKSSGGASGKAAGKSKSASGASDAAVSGTPFKGDVTTSDPCGNRLHDLCGSLLLYYAVNQRLPARAEELADIGGPASSARLVCPVSKQPYVYNPKGLLAPDTRSLIILYDAAPSHDGRRRAISIVEPQRDNDALVAKVVTLPDVFFNRPAATPPPPEPTPMPPPAPTP